ncbi:MAG: hypothetical protein M1816_005102 [Peltula sp. TS41687]|nr:MAG: hypothetical protein M1816_005102 [Peltula sp. TS41687]
MDNLRKEFKRVASGKKTHSMGDERDPLIRRRRDHHDGYQEENQSVWARYARYTLHVAKEVLFHNWVNVLLIFIPLGIVAGAVNWPPTVVFTLNFLAIIPLAALLSFATEELAAKLGQTIGGLLNATFGNAVELIVSIVALKRNEIRIVQASMLGSILSNSLLVLGCCFLLGGIGREKQSFNTTVASTMSSLMAVASISLVIPATLYGVLNASKNTDTDTQILLLSHGTAIILLGLYVMYLYFQLKSHAKIFDGSQDTTDQNGDIESGNQAEQHHDEPLLTPWAAAVVLLLITVCVSICAEYLVASIDPIVETVHISKTFIGLILIPLVGNAAEHVTAVIVARKDKMNLAIGVAMGSSLQIALGVTPFLVILGWIIDRPMTLHFKVFESVVFFLSVIVVNYLIQDGKSNYLEGAMLLGTYLIIALAFYVYPDDAKGVKFFPELLTARR